MLVLIRYTYEEFGSRDPIESSVMVNVDEPTGIYPAFVEHCRKEYRRDARIIEYLPRCNSETWKPEVKRETYFLPPVYGPNKARL